MSKLSYGVLCAVLMLQTVASAAVYKGQRVYQKRCKSCHESGFEIAAKYKKAEWEKIMAEKGVGLAQMHLNNEKADDSWRYFKKKKYRKKARHLKDFLIEYAKDSGKVPACN